MISIFRRENLSVEFSEEAIGGVSSTAQPNSGNYYCLSEPCLKENLFESMQRILPFIELVVTNCSDCKCSDIEVFLETENGGEIITIANVSMGNLLQDMCSVKLHKLLTSVINDSSILDKPGYQIISDTLAHG